MIRFALGLIVLVGALGLLAGCGGDDDESAPAETSTETATTGDETTTDDTGTGETETGEAETGDAANGEAVFASAGCGSCHTLSKAGTSGTVGPNLDDTTLSFHEVVEQVTNGGGAMPPFGDQLSDQEIRDVAAYVTDSGS